MKEKLLFLHGALGSKRQFNDLVDSLQDVYELHTLNFEGHGGHYSSNEFSIALFTENVIDYLEANSINEITIFGYSMGGYVALNAALRIPEKIKKILTLGTKFHWTLASAEEEVKRLDPVKIEEKVPRFAEKLQKEHHPQDWSVVMTKTANMMINMAKGAKLEETDLKKIQVPVVIGIGSLDAMVTYKESEHAATVVPNAILMPLEGVPHPIEKASVQTLSNYILSN